MLKVSVLMPVFNGSAFLRDSIESILCQSFKDFEFIIVDDGSSDATPQILKSFAEKDSRIKIFRNEVNRGIVFSLNRGLKLCSGQYIARMDSDDIALQERIKKQVAAMDAEPEVCVLGTAATYIDALGSEIGKIRYCIPGSRLARTPVMHSTTLIRRKSLVDAGLSYQEKYLFAEDYFLWLQLSRMGKIGALKDVLMQYRLNNGAIKIRKLKPSLWATLKVKRDAIMVLGINPSIKELLIILGETFLLLLPSRLILSLYLKAELKDCKKINL